MEYWIFSYGDGTDVITQERNSLKDHSKISHGVSKNLRAAANSSYILGLGGELCNRRLFERRPTNKRRSKKMTSTRSALSINPTTRKISIGRANKIKRRRSRIPNPKLRSMFGISEDSLNCHPV
jgi:hypothetical protein